MRLGHCLEEQVGSSSISERKAAGGTRRPSCARLIDDPREDEQGGRQITFGLGRLRICEQGRGHSDNGLLSGPYERSERPEEILEFVKQRRPQRLDGSGRSDHNVSRKGSRSGGLSTSPA